MKGIMRVIGISLFPLAGLSISGCMPFLDASFWQSQPPAGTRAVQADLRTSIGYYEKAVTAINSRRYAVALEYLQAARSQKPDDVRVLTAFGVIYDKLGRFDLSARYYGQAAALDPKSRIVAADMDYSRKLQGISGSGTVAVAANTGPDRARDSLSPTVAATELTNRSVATAESARGSVLETQSPSNNANMMAQPAARSVFLTGHPLTIVDASGRSDIGGSVRTYLSGLGWSVARDDGAKLPAQPRTTIVYQETMITAARALARTLSLPAHLSVSDSVQGIQLVLGNDVSAGNLTARPLQARQRQLALATSKSKTRE